MKYEITTERLQSLAGKLMFSLSESEALTLQKEFDIVLQQMDLIGQIEGIHEFSPMTFPYVTYAYDLREDEAEASLTFDEILANAKDVRGNEIKVPKVVE